MAKGGAGIPRGRRRTRAARAEDPGAVRIHVEMDGAPRVVSTWFHLAAGRSRPQRAAPWTVRQRPRRCDPFHREVVNSVDAGLRCQCAAAARSAFVAG
jgi:hypothetical protein